MPRRNLSLLLLALAVGLVCASHNQTNPYGRYVAEGYRLIDQNSLDPPAREKLFEGAMQGMVAVLRAEGDEHSAYLPPIQANPLRVEVSQKFGGIGIRIRAEGDPPVPTVIDPPLPGTPAFESEIKKGDQIVSVNGEPTAQMSLDQALDRMRGQPGEPLLLGILHPGAKQPVDVRLVRQVIHLPSVFGDRRLADGKRSYRLASNPSIALVRLLSFGNRSTEEVTTVLEQLQQAGVRDVILDLRGNAGGALSAAVDLADLFLDEEKKIVAIRDRKSEYWYRATSADQFPDLRLVVLVDRFSASASEILGAALQDHQRAVVMGERSFGKGTVQQMLPIGASRSGPSMLKLTMASFWRPSDVNIHRAPGTPESAPWGVSPDKEHTVRLDDEQQLALLKWRRERDLIPEARPDQQTLDPAIDHDPAVRHAAEWLAATRD